MEAFLAGRIGFGDIAPVIETVLARTDVGRGGVARRSPRADADARRCCPGGDGMIGNVAYTDRDPRHRARRAGLRPRARPLHRGQGVRRLGASVRDRHRQADSRPDIPARRNRVGDRLAAARRLREDGVARSTNRRHRCSKGATLPTDVPPDRVFEAKPVWQRMIIILAGVTLNVVFALLIFTGLAWKNGRHYDPTTTIGQIDCQRPAARSEGARRRAARHADHRDRWPASQVVGRHHRSHHRGLAATRS